MKHKYLSGKLLPKYIYFPLKRPAKRLLYFTGICLYFTVGLCNRTNAQAERSEVPKHFGEISKIKPLQIGDTIPEALWHLPLQVVNHPEGKGTITLNDYRGKLIILDFWATWCSACVKQFPKIDSLQKQFTGQVSALLVSNESEEKVQPYLTGYFQQQQHQLYTVVADEALKACFPWRIVPHYVWISPQGTVAAVTGSDELKASNVTRMLSEPNAALAQKNDIDPDKPLFLSDHIEQARLPYYSILYSGSYPGLPAGSSVRTHGTDTIGVSFSNYSLYRLYAAAARPLFKERGDTFNRLRCIIEVPASDGLETDLTKPYSENKLFSFDLIVTPGQAGQLYHTMLDQLNRYSGYVGTIQVRRVSCLVISGLKRGNKKSAGPQPSGLTASLQSLINSRTWKQEGQFSSEVMVNESNYTGRIAREIINLKDPAAINQALRPYGLHLREAKRSLPFLVIRKTDT